MPIPRDSHYVPGSGRKSVQLSSGERVSRAAAERQYAQSEGFRSDYQRRQAYESMKDTKYYNADKRIAAERGISSRDFNAMRSQLERDKQEHGGRLSRDPNGPLANYLVAMGRRDPGDTHPVGDSPK